MPDPDFQPAHLPHSVPPGHVWERHPVTLLIGLGNPILGDDGVGWKIVEQVRQTLEAGGAPAFDAPPDHPRVEVDCLALGGLSLMERMIGYRRVILVDALQTGAHPPGSLSCQHLEALPNRALGHLGSAHDTTLHNALLTGRALGVPLPEQVIVVGIEAQCVYDFTEALTPPVAAAVPAAVAQVLNLLENVSKEEA